MQISSVSTTYGGSEAQRLLASLFQQQGPPTGQDLPGDSAAPADGPPSAPTPPANPPDASQFAQATLASLLDTQQQPTSADIAQKVISAVDADGDGALSLAEVEKALGQDTTNGDTGLSQAFAKLDTNGDGKLSQDELASAIDAQNSASGSASGVHHHRHHHHAQQAQGTDGGQPTDGQLASAILGKADTNGDGALSADEIAQALGTNASDSLKQTLAGFDKDGDGMLDSSELAAAIDAFRTAQRQGQTAGANATPPQPVTA